MALSLCVRACARICLCVLICFGLSVLASVFIRGGQVYLGLWLKSFTAPSQRPLPPSFPDMTHYNPNPSH